MALCSQKSWPINRMPRPWLLDAALPFLSCVRRLPGSWRVDGGHTSSLHTLLPPLCCRYNPELTAQWTREIADEIKNKLKNELDLPRYKFVVQAVVGEQRGEGVRMGCRCLWDADTDNYVEDSYRNETLFCVAAVFATYLY